MGERTCFVISPIGGEGTPIRKHADNVYRYIIQPALEQLGIKGVRADHVRQIGNIKEDMFDRILQHDLCIAVLWGHNPNVFYELAIAHAAARPVIMLCERETKIPFDINDQRALVYDLDLDAIEEKTYSRQIVDYIGSLEQSNWVVPVPFAPNLSPLGAGRGEDWEFYSKAMNYGPPDSWLGFLERAQTSFDLCGISLHRWIYHEGAKRILQEAIDRGVRIRVLLLHPDNPAISSFINPKLDFDTVDQVRGFIQTTGDNLCKLLSKSDNCEVRYLHEGAMHQHLIISDVEAAAIFYMYSATTFSSPMIYCPASGALYDGLSVEFAALWEAAPPMAASQQPTAPAERGRKVDGDAAGAGAR